MLAGHGQINIIGEVSSKSKIDIERLVKNVYGVNNEKINIKLVEQSIEIARGVDSGGAGDQGIMIGYACDENKELVPQEYYLARDLCKKIYSHHPADGKTQITIDNNKIVGIVASWQGVSTADLHEIVRKWYQKQNCANDMIICLNEAGDWNIGGLEADTGLTGRKIVVDSYGPRVPVGGGCFSGKDPSKVDRSGAYLARNIAVNYLRKHCAKEVIIKIAYAIGKKEPIMITGTIDNNEISFVGNIWNPKNIIQSFDLYSPIYKQTAEWGAFGNGFSWDK
ncbi:MAG: methionine adenosyltransferase [Candidatus Komeilibacteria bacterium CG_4_9_14_0_8_um_filter_36_9]|uniref:methionine adenosyltransferase n=2 Tax=Candidatus Komeiliibacteriota TaxID=1817908 RepID=A0A2M8DR57_9BACT|nr:MAG: methionine adenosyltransferase [Candidatus Komeilibacteria bacterium CG_4_10_14_0_8_um_filter_37_78]PJC01874.1 MAG: methionine adenosyltransferase [Candidatus Komeilibacteria bacterium CG_4_9_14_0_8_um_filter_36_9]